MGFPPITVRIELGTLAALLTALEYFLSLLSSLSARAAVHGLWLVGLHRGGEARLDTQARTRRIFRRDALVAILGIWLVIGVALVESNLQHAVHVLKTRVPSPLCVSVYGKFDPQRVYLHTPPYRTIVEPWVLDIARDLGCGLTGLASVGVGGTTDIKGQKRGMFAPICADKRVDVAGGAVTVRMRIAKYHKLGLVPRLGHSGGFILFPHRKTGLGKGVDGLGALGEGNGPCGDNGISAYMFVMPGHYETVKVQSDNMTKTVMDSICSLHSVSQRVDVLPDPIVSSCKSKSPRDLDIGCLRSKAERRFIKHVKVPNVSALFLGETVNSTSYACTSTTVKYEYVFINPRFVHKGHPEAKPRLPVLVPTILTALTGHCERTIAPLAQAALLYSADSEWQQDDLAVIPRITRFHAYLIAVSSSQFPLNTVHNSESPKAPNGKCLLRQVANCTDIPTDWRLGILVSGFVVVSAVVLTGLVFRFRFKGEAWNVGSAKWSFERLLAKQENGGKRKTARVEIIPVDDTENDNPSKPQSATNSPSSHRDAISPVADRQYEYRLRTSSIRPSLTNDENISKP